MKTNSSNLWTQYLSVYSLSWERLWGKSCKSFKQIFIFVMKGFLNNLDVMIGSNNWINVLLEAGFVTEKKGLTTIEWGKVRKNSVGMNWNWGCQYEFISTLCTHVCNACNLCTCVCMSAHSYVYPCMYVYVDIF